MGANISEEPVASVFMMEVKVKPTLKMKTADVYKMLLPTYHITRVTKKVLQEIVFFIDGISSYE
jgi:hypothetical protein